MSVSQTIYFGYGSNLWLRQMKLRCPESKCMGVGMLNGWRLQINERGYCNVVEQHISPSILDSSAGARPVNAVYGLVYSLSGGDEDRLDVNEGVPDAYTKEILPIAFWASEGESAVDVSSKPDSVRMLVYVDRKRIADSEPKREYIYRMNMGVTDALKMGVPTDYVAKAIRKFIPAEVSMSDGDVEEAEQQAMDFIDR